MKVKFKADAGRRSSDLCHVLNTSVSKALYEEASRRYRDSAAGSASKEEIAGGARAAEATSSSDWQSGENPIRVLRQFRGLTQIELATAESVQITQNYLSDLETGKRKGPLELHRKIARVSRGPLRSAGDDRGFSTRSRSGHDLPSASKTIADIETSARPGALTALLRRLQAARGLGGLRRADPQPPVRQRQQAAERHQHRAEPDQQHQRLVIDAHRDRAVGPRSRRARYRAGWRRASAARLRWSRTAAW